LGDAWNILSYELLQEIQPWLIESRRHNLGVSAGCTADTTLGNPKLLGIVTIPVNYDVRLCAQFCKALSAACVEVPAANLAKPRNFLVSCGFHPFPGGVAVVAEPISYHGSGSRKL
jgi:hypothetical protein